MKYRNYNNQNNYLMIGLLMFFLFGGFQLFFVILIPLFFKLLPFFIIVYFIRRLFGKSRLNQRLGAYTYSQPNERSEFVELLIRVLCLCVKADGKIDNRELLAIENIFRVQFKYTPLQVSWIKDLIGHSLKKPENIDVICVEVNEKFDHQSKLLLLQMVYHVVLSDNVVVKAEEDFILTITKHLNISDFEATSIRGHFIKVEDVEKDYAVLGLKSTATLSEVKAAYRELCKKYHPDRVQHLGDEFRQISEEKIKEINKAYDIIKKKLK
jgi:DnaJ like chaperone protein